MAFSKSNYDPTCSGSKGSPPRIHSYASSDALATIMASGYFNSVEDLIRTGDLMVIKSTAAADGGTRLITLTNTDGVITSANAPAGSGKVFLPWVIGATELSAGTPTELISPIAGRITLLRSTVQVAISTGGVLTVEVNTTAVDGLSITVANSATVGTRQSDAPTAAHATAIVAAGDRIEIIPSAAFDGGGALAGILEIEPTT